MKLRKFRVLNYRCIEDSGDIDVGHFNVLVGKNESGKTTLLTALHKFNPATPAKFSALREFPRRRFHEFEESNPVHPVAALTFELTTEERTHLANLSPRLAPVCAITATRSYSGELAVEFHDREPGPYCVVGDMRERIDDLIAAIDALAQFDGVENPESFKQQLAEAARAIGGDTPTDTDLEDKQVMALLLQQIGQLRGLADGDPKQKAVAPLQSKLAELEKAIKTPSPATEIQQYIESQLPVFIYFDIYAMLDSRIDLPSFVQRLQKGALGPDDNTAHTLFQLTKLDVQKLVQLGTTDNKTPEQIREDKDERSLRCNRASHSMSGDLVNIWGQRENRVDFDLDGDFLRLWVVDNIDGAKVELEQRSKGFQWFLSFYVVFMVESELGHKDAILLLDEPGLHLHASAQADMIRVLRKLSEKNPLIYATHSPFMIDTTDLPAIHIVTEDRDRGTQVSNDTWPTDREALFPLQAALGYTLSQSMFLGRNVLLVEGITDYWLLSSLSALFSHAGKTCIDPELIITPAGGATKVVYLAAMMHSQELTVSVLLDADREGRLVREELVKTRILKERHVMTIDEAGGAAKEMELEDLFPEEFYLRFVSESYTKELGVQPFPSPLPEKQPRITQRVEAHLQQKGIQFNKTRPARRMMDHLSKAKIEDLPSDLVANCESLFRMINERHAKLRSKAEE